MEQIILAIGTGMIGATLGYLLGLLTKKFTSPRAQELRKAMVENESYYKTMLGRLKARLKEYEQPSELQRVANRVQGESPEDMVTAFANELPNIRGIPRWARPFIPAIQAYLRENPEQVKELIAKFTGSGKKGQNLNSADAL